MRTDEMSYSIYDHVLRDWLPGYGIPGLSRVSSGVYGTSLGARDILEVMMRGVLHDV